jgi:dihydrodipicolinate synthase/N-acetylneuraminate lyase
MLTPLTDGGQAVDRAAFRPMIDFLLGHGADGLFVCGTTGEGMNLDLEERKQVLRWVREALEGRGSLLIHVGAQTTRDTCALASDAAAVGVDGVAVIPPPYYPLDERELTAHLVAAAAACAPTPFFIYCFTARSGYPVSVQVIERVREQATNLAGLKVSESRFEDVQPYLVLGLPVYIGNEPLIARASAVADIAGSVSALASVFPEATRALLDDPTPERAEAVRALRDAVSRPSVPAAAKALLGRRGVPIHTDMRAPLRAPDAAELEAADQRAAAVLGAAAGR